MRFWSWQIPSYCFFTTNFMHCLFFSEIEPLLSCVMICRAQNTLLHTTSNFNCSNHALKHVRAQYCLSVTGQMEILTLKCTLAVFASINRNQNRFTTLLAVKITRHFPGQVCKKIKDIVASLGDVSSAAVMSRNAPSCQYSVTLSRNLSISFSKKCFFAFILKELST